jgi:probable HAF family extracellular repeat protein
VYTFSGTIVALLALASSALAAPSYTVIAVGPGTSVSEADDINNLNQVVGKFTVTPGTERGFLYSAGVNSAIGTLSGFGNSAAYRINDAGAITGLSHTAGGYPHAFVFGGVTLTDLGTLGGRNSSVGSGINAAGHVVGTASNFGSVASSVGFFWNGSTMTQLPFVGAGSAARDINDSGTIVGTSTVSTGRLHAFVYAAGVMSDLGTLPSDTDSAASRLNNAGIIVGYSQSAAAQPSAVRWTGGAISNLGGLPGGAWSQASDVNAAGVVVGGAKSSTGVLRAVRWAGGSIADLNTEIAPGSGWELKSATAINDNGWIVGLGVYNGVDRGFLLRPVSADTTPPSVSCASADGLWHSANVSIGCTASDLGSGLANPADVGFSLSTSVAVGTETANASTGTRSICDNAANCATAGPVAGNKIDRKAPSITLSAPVNTTYPFNTPLPASYGCNDAGSGVATCTGTVATAAAINTQSVGTQSFTVTATDNAGNTSSTVVQYQVVATNWPQFHNGADRTGVQPSERILDPSNVRGLMSAWATRTHGAIRSSPVVADGIAYASSYDGKLHAFSAANGNPLWTTGTIGANLFSSPAVDQGRVFIGSDDGNVYAFDAASGAPLWLFAAGSPVDTAPVIANGLMYVGSWNGALYALDAATGKLSWSKKLAAPMRGSAAVDRGVVYVAVDSLLAFDALTGKLLWTARCAPCALRGVPAAYAGYVLAGGDDGTLYAFDRSGALLWSAQTTFGMNIVGAPSIDGSLAYIGSCDGVLYAFDLATGAKMWSTNFGRCFWSSPAYANGVVYVGATGTAVVAVDAKTGRELWRYAAPFIYSSPAVADGTVYIGDDDGTVYAFRL